MAICARICATSLRGRAILAIARMTAASGGTGVDQRGASPNDLSSDWGGHNEGDRTEEVVLAAPIDDTEVGGVRGVAVERGPIGWTLTRQSE